MNEIVELIKQAQASGGSYTVHYTSPAELVTMTIGVSIAAICAVIATFAICRMYIKNK